MSEFITIQVGQCGNQIGSVFWPQILEEYGTISNDSGLSSTIDRSFKSFFNCPEGMPKTSYGAADLRRSKVTARALLIDMEEKVVERFKHGSLQHLFDKTCFLSDQPGSGNNWAVGHHTHFRSQRTVLKDKLRQMAEQCDSLTGVLVLLSLGGGTGAGLGSAIVSLLEDQFPLVSRFVTCVHPGQYNDVVTSPYNVALSLHCLSEHASIVIPVDNKALGDICEKNKLNRGTKPFHDVNNIIVNMLLNLTSGSRFSGSLNCDFNDLDCLVPQPALHYISTSFSPVNLTPTRQVSFINKERDLLQEVCSRENQLLRINALGGQLLSAALLCRGQIPLSTLRQYLTRFQSKVKFAAWSDPGVKTGLCSIPPIGHKSAMLCLVNSTNMANFFKDSLNHFNLLYKKKAHIHHYTNVDGFEADDFLLTKESLMSSATKYIEAANFVEVPRLKVS